MISYEQLLQQMAQHIERAAQGDEQHMREQLTAVKALCDVVLNLPKNQQSVVVQNSLVSSFQTTGTLQPQNGQKWQEADANGESIFDF